MVVKDLFMVACVNEYLFGFRLLSSGTACAEGEQEEKGEGGERGGRGEKNQHDDHESHMTCKDSDRSLTSEHTCTCIYMYIMYNTLYYKRVLTQGFAVSEYTLVCSTWT